MNLYCPYCRKYFDIKKELLSCPDGQDKFHVLIPKLPENLKFHLKESRNNPFLKYRQFISSYHLLGKKRYSAVLNRLSINLEKIGEPDLHTTPLINEPKLEKKFKLNPDSLYIKVETGNVSGSHKSRHALGNLLYIESVRILNKTPKKNLAIYSCGNAALGASAASSALGYKLYAFVPENVDREIEARLVKYGTKVVRVKRDTLGTGDPCYLRFRESIDKLNLVPCSCSGPDNWPNIEGGATIIYEFISQMQERYESFPDNLFIQVGGGALASSIIYGLNRLVEVKLINKLPRIFLVQTESCYPLFKTYQKVQKMKRLHPKLSIKELMQKIGSEGHKFMFPWSANVPESLAEGILDDTTYDWLAIIDGVLKTQGDVLVVKEKEIVDAFNTVKKLGMNISATGTSGLAGLMQALENKKAKKGEKIGLFFTGIDSREKIRVDNDLLFRNSHVLSSKDPIESIL